MKNGQSQGRRRKVALDLTARDISQSLGKMPPQALDLEAKILGVCMLESRGLAMKTILAILRPEDFYLDANREIFQAIYDLYKTDNPVHMLAVRHQMLKTGKLDLVGGSYVLAELTAKVSSSADAEFDCRVIKEMSMKRSLIQLASMIHHKAYEDTQDVFLLMDELEYEYQLINSGVAHNKVVKIGDSLHELTLQMQARIPGQPAITGVPSGFMALDKLTLGWQKTDLVIIAARPGMGKTAFIVSCALNAAVKFKIPVAIFSLEMGTIQLTMRFAAVESDIPLRDIRSKPLTDLEWTQFMHKTSQLADSGIYIDDTAALSLQQFRAQARKFVEENKVQLIIVDYLQLMRGDDNGNREQEISSISRGLKQTAKELDVPVLALSQLARATESRGGTKEPQLNDLRESGAIEQDADIVMFLWKPDYYKITHDVDGRPFAPGITKMTIAKHRNGAPGETFVRFIGRSTKFEDTDSPYLFGNEGETNSGFIARNDRTLTDFTEPRTPNEPTRNTIDTKDPPF